jgi:SAM-dependent methyltransferase
MQHYAVMIYPSANRVYADASIRLMANELRVFDNTVLGGVLHDVTERSIADVPYVTFSAPPLTERQLDMMANLSARYALFEIVGDMFRPIPVRSLDAFDNDLLTIQKYSGKTNELFTKLLLNVTALGTDRPEEILDARLRVFDPLCGRGTTLNQAMMYGYEASGMDIDGHDFDEYSRFIRTWLKNKRIKHQATITPIRREKRNLGRRLDISVGISKESYKSGDALRLSFVQADAVRAAEFFKPETFDIIVTDAPYGVRHGSTGPAPDPTGDSRSRSRGTSRRSHEPTSGVQLSRTPVTLLAEAVPGWVTLLRPGGALGISWNTHGAGRDEIADVLGSAGLTVLDKESYLGFEHRVDQAIIRDLMVARKP